jgi:hypothetical protein
VPLESIVLIAFDATKIRRIKRALESLLWQTHTNLR